MDELESIYQSLLDTEISYNMDRLESINQCFLDTEISHKNREKKKDELPCPMITKEICDRIDLTSVQFPKKEDHEFESVEVDKYLSSLTAEDQIRVREIFARTRHISTDELLLAFQSLIDKFNSEEEIYLFFSKRFCSENMYLILFWSSLRKLNIKGFLNEDSHPKEKKIKVLLLDDAIYTGQNIFNMLDCFLDSNPEIQVDFNLIVPFVSSYGLKTIMDIVEPSDFHNYDKRATINISLIEEIPEFTFDWGERFKVYDGKRLLLYFDHKIAETTFEAVYFGYNPETKESLGCLLKTKPFSELKLQIYSRYLSALDQN